MPFFPFPEFMTFFAKAEERRVLQNIASFSFRYFLQNEEDTKELFIYSNNE